MYAGLSLQMISQSIHCPYGKAVTIFCWLAIERFCQHTTELRRSFSWSPTARAVLQSNNAPFSPTAMPHPNGVGTNGNKVCHLLRFVPQMQQADCYRSLAHFGMRGGVDGLLKFRKL